MTIIADQPQATKVEPGQPGGPLLATVRRTLVAAGTDEALITRATQIVATGIVYDAWLTGVRELGNVSLLEITESLELVIDHIVTGTPLTRARMAAEALSATPPAQAGHHPWCLVDQCRAHRYDDGEVLTEHQGPKLTASITDGDETLLLRAELGSDEALVDDHASVSLSANDADGLMVDAAGLDKVIADFDTFLDGLRGLRRVMGQARAPRLKEQA